MNDAKPLPKPATAPELFQLAPSAREALLTQGVRRLMEVARAGGGAVRVVGGAVRDVIMGRAPGDIDLATTLPPQALLELLPREGIKAVATGLAHGTITAVLDHRGYEITTLRRDVATDGRHATVAFTDDWRADAARRDFTMNALYLDADGVGYDYFGGRADAQAGCVRFIGEAEARIREDVLRILRYFRFLAWFGQDVPDPAALAACRALAHLMPRLSAERVARETLKLLAAPDPASVWLLTMETGVARVFLDEANDLGRLRRLLVRERSYGVEAEPLLRLAALLSPDETIAAACAARLKFSRHDTGLLAALARLPNLLAANLGAHELRTMLYRHGVEACRLALLLLDESCEEQLASARATVAAWEAPRFPLLGEDLLRLGLQPGPQVGALLRTAEQWWIDGDFRASRAACLGFCQEKIAQIEK